MNRRRCLSVVAGTSAALLSGCRDRRGVRATTWEGVLFNAEVDLTVHGLPRARAERLIGQCVTEMQRLERLFSLYVPNSVLSTLNREGRFARPPVEFVSLVGKALEVAEESGGAFDPTVQPYWLWLREQTEEGQPLEASERERMLALVNHRKVRCAAEEIRFEEPGMAMTLNGIAQGWITDRICELLREGGAEHCLVNLGEFYALGAQPSGRDWQVAIRGSEGELVRLRERALAVSSGAGLFFGTGSGRNHLIDPRHGTCAEDRRIVAVTAEDACMADALSTACAVLGDEEARFLVERFGGARVQIMRTSSVRQG